MTQIDNTQIYIKLITATHRTVQENGNTLGITRNNPPINIKRMSERAIAHRIAVHLETEFVSYNIDCEYNRNMGNSKEIGVDFSYLSENQKMYYLTETMKNVHTEEDIEEIIRILIPSYPDIIVHERGNNDNNLLIVEIKCQGDSRGPRGEMYDRSKLSSFTSQYGDYRYTAGVFMNINRSRTDFYCYEDGNQVKYHRLSHRTGEYQNMVLVSE